MRTINHRDDINNIGFTITIDICNSNRLRISSKGIIFMLRKGTSTIV